MTHGEREHGLRQAALALCGNGAIQERLERAHRHLVHVDATALPGSLGVPFEELVADLGYGGDTVAEALTRMNPTDQCRLAERIVILYGELCRGLPVEE